MTFQELAQKLATTIQTVPELFRVLKEGFEDMEAGSNVTVTQVQTSGNKIATITVGEEATDIYAPEAAAAAVFFDGTSAAIESGNINTGSVTHTTYEYTATEDCYFMITTGKGINDTLDIKIEGKSIWTYGTGYSFNEMTIPVLLKSGQQYKASGLGAYCAYVVRKVK